MRPPARLLAPVFVLLATPPHYANAQTSSPDSIVPDSARVELRTDPSERELSEPTRVVVLGTGNPIPDARRFGPGIAVIHKGESYLFDVGSGVIQNATRARYRYDIPSLYPTQICCVFLTHLHSDHTLDYVELSFTMWWRRFNRVLAFGPTGLKSMTEGMLAMMQPDIRVRESGSQPVNAPVASIYEPLVTEISEGVVFEKDDLVVEAFKVNHGDIRPAFGYRITTDDKSIVISGDTAFSETLIEKARGVDLLFHEAISDAGLLRTSEAFQAYHKRSHTTATELARLARAARPGKLVVYHVLYYGLPEQTVLDEIRRDYDGEVVLANDLDLF